MGASTSDGCIIMRHRSKLTSTKHPVTKKKLGQIDKNTAKNCHLYAPISQKLFSKSKGHLLNAAHEQTLLSVRKRHTAYLLIFTISSKRRLKK